jgi:hypothetical protein
MSESPDSSGLFCFKGGAAEWLAARGGLQRGNQIAMETSEAANSGCGGWR